MTTPTPKTATTTATHYTLAIQTHSTTYTHPDGHDETITIAELIATNSESGERYAYVGPVACSTRDQAMALHARIFNWEWASGKTFDPTRNPKCWMREPGGMDATPAAWVAHEGLGDRATAGMGNGPAKPRRNRRKIVG